MAYWILISIFILLIILGILCVIFRRKNKNPTDYYTLFIIGIIWAGAGIPLKNYSLSIIGLIFLVVGLLHKDKWKENRRKWENLEDGERKWMIFLFILLGLLVLFGLVFYYLYSAIL